MWLADLRNWMLDFVIVNLHLNSHRYFPGCHTGQYGPILHPFLQYRSYLTKFSATASFWKIDFFYQPLVLSFIIKQGTSRSQGQRGQRENGFGGEGWTGKVSKEVGAENRGEDRIQAKGREQPRDVPLWGQTTWSTVISPKVAGQRHSRNKAPRSQGNSEDAHAL